MTSTGFTSCDAGGRMHRADTYAQRDREIEREARNVEYGTKWILLRSEWIRSPMRAFLTVGGNSREPDATLIILKTTFESCFKADSKPFTAHARVCFGACSTPRTPSPLVNHMHAPEETLHPTLRTPRYA
jgi:hypothetical protein